MRQLRFKTAGGTKVDVGRDMGSGSGSGWSENTVGGLMLAAWGLDGRNDMVHVDVLWAGCLLAGCISANTGFDCGEIGEF